MKYKYINYGIIVFLLISQVKRIINGVQNLIKLQLLYSSALFSTNANSINQLMIESATIYLVVSSLSLIILIGKSATYTQITYMWLFFLVQQIISVIGFGLQKKEISGN